MSVDFATDKESFGQASKVFFLAKGESGQYYLADDTIMYPIDKGAYSLALTYVKSLGPQSGYAIVPDAEIYSMSAYLYEEGTVATVSKLGDIQEVSALIRGVLLPVKNPPADRKTVMSISLKLNNGDAKALENIGIYNYSIYRSEEGEYFIGSNHSIYYPSFKITEKDAMALMDIARRVAGEQ